MRRALHRLGLRYWVHRRPLPGLRRQADVVFPRARVALFLNGCYWHGCAEHGHQPQVNRWYWDGKIERNRQRDADTDAKLTEAGWLSIRIWEHDDVEEAARRVMSLLAERRGRAWST